MKIRILPLLGFLFTLAIVSRAVALSNDPPGGTSEAAAESLKADNTSKDGVREEIAIEFAKKQCLSGEVLIAVNKKMAALAKREDEMKENESAFAAIRLRLDKQLLAINAAKASLDENIFKRTEQAQEDLSHLTQMYQSMKPKQAAKIFNEMDVNFAAGFLREMKGAHAGLILSNMNTKKAYQISLVLASRSAKYRDMDNRLP